MVLCIILSLFLQSISSDFSMIDLLLLFLFEKIPHFQGTYDSAYDITASQAYFLPVIYVLVLLYNT